jgi:hypothetical protein
VRRFSVSRKPQFNTKRKKSRGNGNRYFNKLPACTLRGLKDARVQDVMTLENEKYDTILLLMNGMRKLKNIPKFLVKLKTLLNQEDRDF